VACEENTGEPDGRPNASYVVESTRAELAGVALASATAFAFAARADGATLVWAPPGERTEIRELRLSRGGHAMGGSSRVVETDTAGGVVTDLVARRVGTGLAVAWVERLKEEARLQAALDDHKGPSTVFDLGPAWHTEKAVRGNVALAAERDSALVFARGQSEPCVSPGERECFSFGLHRIGSEASRARGLPLSVPVPCEQYSAHLSVREGGWYYGVCTALNGERVTTLFDIQFNPEYARAERLLPGCQPLGIVHRGKDPWLLGRCGEKRRGVRLVGAGEPPAPLELNPARFECAGRNLQIVVGDEPESLETSRTDLGPLLPDALTRRLEQVVYTGNSLLVARSEGQKLIVERHACAPKAQARK